MLKDLDLWQLIINRLEAGEAVMLLVVAESSGSSPGRQGYKMGVAGDGELTGSIGGGIMEVRLVEQAKGSLSEPEALATGFRDSAIKQQVHQKHSPNASGMICSGKQIVIFRRLVKDDAQSVKAIIDALKTRSSAFLTISSTQFSVGPPKGGTQNEDFTFEKVGDIDFVYQEKLGPKNELYVVGGGHCALALSELISRMDFHIRIFDDRPDLNTLDKNRFADEIMIIESYDRIGEMIADGGQNIYVVVMTLGYVSDAVVIRQLIDKDFKYFGVLGSKAKMKTLLSDLRKEGYREERLAKIYTPIGLPINSQTPDEIAVSIAAQIIALKNRARLSLLNKQENPRKKSVDIADSKG